MIPAAPIIALLVIQTGILTVQACLLTVQARRLGPQRKAPK